MPACEQDEGSRNGIQEPKEETVMAKSHDAQKSEKKKPLKTPKEKKQAKREKKKG
jgi:hypothetical protein